MTAVAREQRHTKAKRCRICGGADGDPRGKDLRCNGFENSDGSYVNCSREDHAGALEADANGLFGHRMNGPCKCGSQHGADLRPSYVSEKSRIVAEYDYRDERGELLFQVVRFDPKTFRQRKPNGAGGWLWKIGDTRQVPYRLPELIRAVGCGETIYIVEGEKDCDAMARAGFTATCNPMGAGKWPVVAATAREVLAGTDVVVIADADEPGRKHAREVAASLQGVARSVTMLEAPSPYKDVAALFGVGRTLAELVPIGPDDMPLDAPGNDTSAEEPIVISTIGVADIFAPLPPIEWTVEGLGLTAGAAAALAGFGFVGKTIVAQTIILAIASGRPLWGIFHAGKARALHLDFEQGRRLTSERYQRLAKGAGIDPGDLGDNLRLAVMPEVYLDNSRAADAYARAFDGFAIAVVDSLRAAAPSADENSSEIRRHIDVLTRASELTGCLPMFLHHARKPTDAATGGAKMTIRGSSAIYDACASVFVLEADKGKPTRVHHEKDRARGILMPDFGLQIEDVAIGDDARAGLRVVHLDGAQLGDGGAAETAKLDALDRKVLAAVMKQPGMGKESICKAVGVNRTAFYQAVTRLVETSGVEERREGKAKTLWPV